MWVCVCVGGGGGGSCGACVRVLVGGLGREVGVGVGARLYVIHDLYPIPLIALPPIDCRSRGAAAANVLESCCVSSSVTVFLCDTPSTSR